jgi:hypothetical protein
VDDELRNEFLTPKNNAHDAEYTMYGHRTRDPEDVLDFYEQAATRYNSLLWAPRSLAAPELHPAFAESKLLPLIVDPITAYDAKSRLTTCAKRLDRIIARWKDENDLGDDPVVAKPFDQFSSAMSSIASSGANEEMDSRKRYLGTEPPHLLYLWHVTYMFGIFSQVLELKNEDASRPSSPYVSFASPAALAASSTRHVSANPVVLAAPQAEAPTDQEEDFERLSKLIEQRGTRRTWLEKRREELDQAIFQFRVDVSGISKWHQDTREIYDQALAVKEERRQDVLQELEAVKLEIKNLEIRQNPNGYHASRTEDEIRQNPNGYHTSRTEDSSVVTGSSETPDFHLK